MSGIKDPAQYEAWYHTARGSWIADQEFSLMMKLIRPPVDTNATLLDVGCGTGHFSRRFTRAGLKVTGLDADNTAITYARQQDKQEGNIDYVHGTMLELPFANYAYDYCAAVTSLCFVSTPDKALREMWRVCRKGIVLGLLNRHSLLYVEKHGHDSYQGARWDTHAQVKDWIHSLRPIPQMQFGTAVFLPGGGTIARWIEKTLPTSLPWGAFLAVYLDKS